MTFSSLVENVALSRRVLELAKYERERERIYGSLYAILNLTSLFIYE